jgi:hypothetical protein
LNYCFTIESDHTTSMILLHYRASTAWAVCRLRFLGGNPAGSRRDSATGCRRRSGVRHHYERGDTQRADELLELALDLTEPPRTNGSHRPTHRVNGNPNGHSSQRQPSAERRGTAANKPLSQRILSVEPTGLLRALTDTIRWILSVEPPSPNGYYPLDTIR